MNIGDYVYLYLFDLKKSITNMEELRYDRFGRIINMSVLTSSHNSENYIAYEIQLLYNNKVIEYCSNNLSTSLVSISTLIELIGGSDISSEKKNRLLEQVDAVIKGISL